jgi:hypothetical protein
MFSTILTNLNYLEDLIISDRYLLTSELVLKKHVQASAGNLRSQYV